MNKNDARVVAFAIAFYASSQSSGINRNASVLARQTNGERIETIKDTDLDDAKVILYDFVRGLSYIPYYWSVSARTIQLTQEELDTYVSGTLISWLQFSSSKKGFDPSANFSTDHNAHFIIYSATGRPIKHFSIVPDEEEILFLPHSTFLVIDHRKDETKHYIYIRQIELGLCKSFIL